jgi:hypothetical protein
LYREGLQVFFVIDLLIHLFDDSFFLENLFLLVFSPSLPVLLPEQLVKTSHHVSTMIRPYVAMPCTLAWTTLAQLP